MLCKETHDRVIRVAPPLVITREEIDWAYDKFVEVLRFAARGLPEHPALPGVQISSRPLEKEKPDTVPHETEGCALSSRRRRQTVEREAVCSKVPESADDTM